MFSSGLSGPMAPDTKKAKPLTQAERYEQALVTAKVFLDDSNARVIKAVDKYNAVAQSNYWFYGYCGANMAATMGLCLALGNRWPFFRSYSSFFSLAGGYFGGKACLGAHSYVILGGAVKQIEHEISEAQRMDEHTGHMVPDYLREAERLKSLKYELLPTLPEAIAARTEHREVTLDDRADALVDAYLKRKEALEKK